MQPISSLSTQYVRAKVTAVDDSGNPVTISGDAVAFAFTDITSNPVVWLAGSWGSGNIAKVLVGPGGGATTLSPSTYQVWLKVTDSPEVPVLKVDTLSVY